MAQTQRMKVGALGEDIACRYLRQKGFIIQVRNYRKPWSEIDIIAKSDKGIHFIEVKSVRAKKTSGYRAEENVTSQKLRRIGRGALTFLAEKKIATTEPWQIDVIAVEIDFDSKSSKLRYIESVIRE